MDWRSPFVEQSITMPRTNAKMMHNPTMPEIMMAAANDKSLKAGTSFSQGCTFSSHSDVTGRFRFSFAEGDNPPLHSKFRLPDQEAVSEEADGKQVHAW